MGARRQWCLAHDFERGVAETKTEDEHRVIGGDFEILDLLARLFDRTITGVNPDFVARVRGHAQRRLAGP